MLNSSPELLVHLQVVQMKARQARAISDKIQNDRKNKASLLTRLAANIEAGKLTKKEVEDFLSGLPRTVKEAASPGVQLFIAPNWDVLRGGDGSVRVVVSTRQQAGTAIGSWVFKS